MSPEVFGWNLAFIILTNYLEFAGCQKDTSLKTLVEDYWDWKQDEYPSVNTPHATYLESFSLERFEKRKNDALSFLDRAGTIDIESLTEEDQLTLKLFKYQLNTFAEGYKWADYGNLNPISMLEPMHLLSGMWVSRGHYNTYKEYMGYIQKLEKIPTQVMEMRTLMERAVRLKRTNHMVSMKGVVESINELGNTEPTGSMYYGHFRRLDLSISISSSDKQSLKTKGITVIRRILTAFTQLAEWMAAEYIPNTRPHEGVWSLDNGTQYYMDALKWHLSSDMHPETVHRTGLMEVSLIKKKMENVMSFLGFSGDLPSFFEHLRRQRSFYNHTQEEYLQLFKDAVYRKIQPNLHLFFPNLESIPPVTIRKSPKNSLAASYWFPVMQVNTFNPHTRENFTVLAISLHEALPGHHLQMSYTRNQDLPNFRRYFDAIRKYPVPFYFPYYTAYVEGWGLYAEYMGEEMGLFSDPYEMFGKYCFEMFRACRLVVDTGIHMKGWTRQQAVTYLQKHTFIPKSMLEMEVDRYITWPGQACSYKIGELKIKELRRKAEKLLGYKFNVIEFHDAVLKGGPVPLAILEDIVNKWINNRLQDKQYIKSNTNRLYTDTNILVVLLCVVSINSIYTLNYLIYL